MLISHSESSFSRLIECIIGLRFVIPDDDGAEICGLVAGGRLRGLGPRGNAPNELVGIFSSMLLFSRRLLSFNSPRVGFWSIMSRMVSKLPGMACCEIDVDEFNGVMPKPPGTMAGGSKGCDC